VPAATAAARRRGRRPGIGPVPLLPAVALPLLLPVPFLILFPLLIPLLFPVPLAVPLAVALAVALLVTVPVPVPVAVSVPVLIPVPIPVPVPVLVPVPVPVLGPARRRRWPGGGGIREGNARGARRGEYMLSRERIRACGGGDVRVEGSMHLEPRSVDVPYTHLDNNLAPPGEQVGKKEMKGETGSDEGSEQMLR
jgi:hypothetical protein